ncbi:MAG: proline--tRNA ligase [Mollicutes bacterium]|nr:proline--tRNA ligase [Mollicutes bacterium]
MAEKKVKNITSRDQDFGAWYTDVVKEADLIDYSSVKGSMIIRPYGYAIWENMVNVLDNMFKETGHVNVQMPLFIPESLFNIEKDHVEGFAPEVAVVTEGGNEKLEEKMIIRPTSEVLFCDHYKKIINSYRDLPLLYNQWCTIVRWEKETRPFLRSREILWQEGHTMHATEEEAREETLRMFKIYETFQKEYLAIPVITGKKTEKEKFAGAEETYTIEAMMYNGIALQNGTSHYFGQKFSKAFGIEFLDKENKLVNPYQTSWGVSTRMIGGLIMTHSDDFGLVLPPKIAPTKVAVIPIGNDERLDLFIETIKEDLKDLNITYTIMDLDKSPGYKFAEAEVKGYPIRVEVGNRDLQAGVVTLVRRDTLEKITVNMNEVIPHIQELLDLIQDDMYNRALQRRDAMIYQVDTIEELRSSYDDPGFFLVNWCGSEKCENSIREEFGLKSRCIKDDVTDKKCIVCNSDSKHSIYFGKQY